MAVGILYSQGYEILETKFKCKHGEVDIIVKKNNRISFIEVKTRQSQIMGRPAEAVTRSKQNRIKLGARIYIDRNKLYNYEFDFQVIEILFNQIENAFY